MGLSLEERQAELREIFRLSDLRDLRGVEFQRLLRLAHSEGLLAELMQDIGCEDRQEDNRRSLLEGSGEQAEPQKQTIPWPWPGPRYLRTDPNRGL